MLRPTKANGPNDYILKIEITEKPPMKEWRCDWAVVPGAHNPPRVNFVEAPDEETARRILTDHIERTEGVRLTIRSVEEYIRPTAGKVLS